MSDSALFGLDTIFKTVEADVKRKSDIIIVLIHWCLTKQGFRAIGLGDERTIKGDEEKSELLPAEWNGKNNYTIRYLYQNKLHILHGLQSDDSLIINLMRSDDLAVTNIAYNVGDVVKETSGSVNKMIPTHAEIIYKMKKEVIDFFTGKDTRTSQTQTDSILVYHSQQQLRENPLLERPRGNSVNSDNLRDLGDIRDWQDIGRSDLNPFNPMGGGMIFNPFGRGRRDEIPGLGIPGGLPRGAVPPGARFDPFGPPGVPARPGRRPPPPDSDHFPPPGFDHMFM